VSAPVIGSNSAFANFWIGPAHPGQLVWLKEPNVMVHRITNILSRFPEDEKAVCALIHESREFEALCQEYAETGRELDRLTGPNKPNAIVGDALQRRRIALEEEILTRIEGYTPA
jgi:hypothetical protein